MIAFLSFLSSSEFWIEVGILAAVYGIAALGAQLNLGSTGILNFGQAGFMAIGAYAMALLVLKVGLSLWVGMVLGVGVAVIAGILVGLTSLRLRGDYFALTTLAFAEIVRSIGSNARDFTGGDQGLSGYDVDWQSASVSISDWLVSIGIEGSFLLPLLIVSWVVFVALAVGLRALASTPWGRVLNAVRSDEDGARALGKNTLSYKLQSLAISAGLAALAGYVLALNLALLVPRAFESALTVLTYAVVVLAGFRSYLGILVGAVVLLTVLEGTAYLDLPFSDDELAALRYMLVGLLIILLMGFRPQGAFGRREEMVLDEH